MPSTGTPASSRPGGAGGAPSAYTEAGPPDRMTAFGWRASISAAGMVLGTISEYTRHSRTRRAISCAYWAPKSTTSTVSTSPSAVMGGVPFRSGRDLDPGDPAPVQLGRGQLVTVGVHVIADRRQLAEAGDHVARHGLVRSLGQLDPGHLGELVQVEQAVHLQLAARELPGRAAVAGAVLVPDVTAQLPAQAFHPAATAPPPLP